MKLFKKIRSLQNLVYGKAFLVHWASASEKAQVFIRHFDGLALGTNEKNKDNVYVTIWLLKHFIASTKEDF